LSSTPTPAFPPDFFEGTIYGLTFDEIRTNPAHIDRRAEEIIDQDTDVNLKLLLEDIAGLNGVRGVESSRLVAKAVLWIMEAYKDDPGITPTSALDTALIWDRG
jgi:hypothetical protein